MKRSLPQHETDGAELPMLKIFLAAVLLIGVGIGLALPAPSHPADTAKVSQIATLSIG